MRTLIVEDDPLGRRLLEILVATLGQYDATATGSGAVDAVTKALAEGRPYTVTLLDVHLPDMDGIEALRRIRAVELKHRISYGAGARIVMTTATSDTRTVSLAFGAMCDAYLVKPVTAAKLFAALGELGLKRSPPAELLVQTIPSRPPGSLAPGVTARGSSLPPVSVSPRPARPSLPPVSVSPPSRTARPSLPPVSVSPPSRTARPSLPPVSVSPPSRTARPSLPPQSIAPAVPRRA